MSTSSSPGSPTPLPRSSPALLGATHAHVGIVTNDFAAAKREIGALLGLEWGDDFDGSSAPAFCSGDGRAAPGLRRTNTSTGGPMRIELLEGTPGSVWATDHLSRLHHVAYNVDDFDGCVAALLSEGWTIEVTLDAPSPDPAVGFAYLVKHGESRIEITPR